MVTAKKIRDTRALSGWSAERCADVIGIPRLSWFNWEAGLLKMPDHLWILWMSEVACDIEKALYGHETARRGETRKELLATIETRRADEAQRYRDDMTRHSDYQTVLACLDVIADICEKYGPGKGAAHYIAQLRAGFKPQDVDPIKIILDPEPETEQSVETGTSSDDWTFEDVAGVFGPRVKRGAADEVLKSLGLSCFEDLRYRPDLIKTFKEVMSVWEAQPSAPVVAPPVDITKVTFPELQAMRNAAEPRDQARMDNNLRSMGMVFADLEEKTWSIPELLSTWLK